MFARSAAALASISDQRRTRARLVELGEHVALAHAVAFAHAQLRNHRRHRSPE